MRHIDVHQHVLSPTYTCSLKSKGIHAPGRRELPQRSPERAIALMGPDTVETAVLSLSFWHLAGGRAAMAGRPTSAAQNPSRTAPPGSGTSSLPAPRLPIAAPTGGPGPTLTPTGRGVTGRESP